MGLKNEPLRTIVPRPRLTPRLWSKSVIAGEQTRWRFIIKAVQTLLFLYLVSLISSMAGMEIFSTLAILVFFGLALFKKNQQIKWPLLKHQSLFLFGLVVVTTLSVIINEQFGVNETKQILSEQRWIFLLLSFPIIFRPFIKSWPKAFRWMLVPILIISVYSIIQSFTGIDIFRSAVYTPDTTLSNATWRAKGLFSSTMTYSYSLAIVACLLFSQVIFTDIRETKSKPLALITLVLLLISLYFTYTRGVWISLVAGFCVIVFYRNIKWGYTFILGSLLAIGLAYLGSDMIQQRIDSIFNPNFDSNSQRLSLWAAYLEMFKDYPLTGNGFRLNSQFVLDYYDKLGIVEDFSSHSHSNYLQYLSGAGVFGLSFYLLLFGSFITTAHKRIKDFNADANFFLALFVGVIGGMVTFHVGGLTQSNFIDGEVRHMLLFTTGIVMAVILNDRLGNSITEPENGK